MKIKKEEIPVVMEGPGTVMRVLGGYGDHDAVYHELPKGTDFTPLLKGLPNDSCHCPHLGYIFEGAFKFIYDDGTEETYRAGDVYYAPAGHTAIVEEDVKFLDFSPTREHGEVLTHVQKVMAEASQ
jgi:hypothetical protein